MVPLKEISQQLRQLIRMKLELKVYIERLQKFFKSPEIGGKGVIF